MPKIRRKMRPLRKAAGSEAQRRQAVSRFLEPHTGKQAGKVAAAQAGLEFNPVIRQMRGEAKASRRRERDVGNWYDQLAGDYNSGAASAADAFKTAEAATTQRTAEAGARGVSALKELADQDSQLAELIGGPKNSQGLSQMAAGQAVADRQQATLAAPNTEAGANTVAYLGRRAASARLAGIEGRQKERRARGKIQSDLATARRERGKATAANMETLRAGDRDYAIQQRAFPLEKAKLAQEARQDAISNRQDQEKIRISRRGARTSERSQKETERHNQATEGEGGLTPSERRTRREHRGDAMSAAKALLAVKVPKNAKQWAQFENALIEKLGSSYSTEAARAVAKLRRQQNAGNKAKRNG